MSFYNMIHGTNPFAPILLGMLGLEPSKCGRFRDCYMSENGKEIVVYTRNGGGNRDEYQPVIDELAKHPNYLRDEDDDYDCTYASIFFSVPEEFKTTCVRIADKTDTTPPNKRWEKFIEDLSSDTQNSKTSRAKEIMGEVIKAIQSGQSKEIKTPEGSVSLIQVPKKDKP